MTSLQVGGIVSGSPVAWLSEGRCLFAGFGKSVRAYSLPDGKNSLRTAGTFSGHEARIVSVVSTGPSSIASASTDGILCVWDVENGSLRRTIDLGYTVSAMTSIGNNRVIVASLSKLEIVSLPAGGTYRIGKKKIVRFVMNNGHMPRNQYKSLPRRLSASSDGTVITAVCDNSLYVLFIAGDGKITTIRIVHRHVLTAVAVSPDGLLLAVADSNGVIRMARDIGVLNRGDGELHTIEAQEMRAASFHWHSKAVQTLCFSPLGNILYSGGSESVLVMWTTTRTGFGDRTFKSRLNASIWGISVSPNETDVAITTAENTIHIMNASNRKIISTIRGLAASHLRGLPEWHLQKYLVPPYATFKVVPEAGNTGCVASYGISNSVQLFDIFNGSHKFDMLINASNTIGTQQVPFRRGKRVGKSDAAPFQVKCVAFSSDKLFMATLTQEVTLEGGNKSKKVLDTLKFWDYGYGRGSLTLLSRIDHPHGKYKDVSSMAFHPSLPVLATTSSGGTFKLWRAASAAKESTSCVWRCELTQSYKNMPCETVSFSPDGSMVAVGCGSVVTLWSLENNIAALTRKRKQDNSYNALIPVDEGCSLSIEFMHALVHPPLEEQVSMLSFITLDSPLLLALTVYGVYIWQVLEQRIWWSSRILNRPECTAVDPKTGTFAVVTYIPSSSGTFEHEKSDRKMNSKKGSGNAGHDSRRFRRKRRPRGDSIFQADFQEPDARERAPEKCTTNKLAAAVAVFNSSSPIPLHVTRLAVGVDAAGLVFLSDPSKADATRQSLVCIDSEMELTEIPTVDSSTAAVKRKIQSSVLGSVNAPEGNLDTLIGSEWKRQASNPESEKQKPSAKKSASAKVGGSGIARSQAEYGPIERIVNKTLEGPAHVQPPISAFSLSLLRDLINVTKPVASPLMSSEREGKEDEEDRPGDNTKDVKLSDIQPSTKAARSQIKADSDKVDLEAMSSFLKSLVPSA